jgi:hypothetical protein
MLRVRASVAFVMMKLNTLSWKKWGETELAAKRHEPPRHLQEVAAIVAEP